MPKAPFPKVSMQTLPDIRSKKKAWRHAEENTKNSGYISHIVHPLSYSIQPLGDRAIRLVFEAQMNPVFHTGVLRIATMLDRARLPGILDIVPAYHEIGIHYDPVILRQSGTGRIADRLAEWIGDTLDQAPAALLFPSRLIDVPVCYDPLLAPDLPIVADRLGLSTHDVITIHTSVDYHVYMLGFMPGFPYLGILPDALFMPRKASPAPTAAGSVAIAGRQTGIYPIESPGGWHVIGRTPLILFDPSADPPATLRPGDTVRFISISRDAFDRH